MKKLIMSLGFALATVFAVQAQEVPQEDQSSQEQTAPEAGEELEQEEVAPEEGETEELPADETTPAEGETAPEEGVAPAEEETIEENPNDEVILEEQSEEANPNK